MANGSKRELCCLVGDPFTWPPVLADDDGGPVMVESRRVQSASNDLGDRLIELVETLLGADARLPRPFPLDQKLSELGISSLKMVNLMLAVETAFDIMSPQADITPENFHSVATIRALVERTLQKSSSA
jgi:acyl carrier protein